jgi:hypothetical protein
MQQPDQTAGELAGTPADEPRAGIGLGSQIAIMVGALPVLVVLNNMTERLVTDVVGLSPWFMAGAFAALTVVGMRRFERAGTGEAGTLWFAAWISWLFASLDVVARVSGLSEMLTVWGVVAGLLAWRWFEVRRGRRESIFGPLLDRST